MEEPRRNRMEPRPPRGWAPHPQERMLMTPLIAGLGGLGTSLQPGEGGARALRRERVLRLPLGIFAPAGRSLRALLPVPESLRARRLLRERSVAEPARDRAHRARPLAGLRLASGRLAPGSLLEPALHRPALADAVPQVALLGRSGRAAGLVHGGAQRQVGAAALRRSAVRQAPRPHRPGLPGAVPRLPGRAQEAARGQGDQATAEPARGGSEPRADRPRLLALREPSADHGGEPAPRQGDLPAALRRLPRPRR